MRDGIGSPGFPRWRVNLIEQRLEGGIVYRADDVERLILAGCLGKKLHQCESVLCGLSGDSEEALQRVDIDVWNEP